VSKIFIVTYCRDEDIEFLKGIIEPGDVVVGVDQGIDLLLQNGVRFDYCIGDFDSAVCDVEGLGLTPEHIMPLQIEKDVSDLEYALQDFADSEGEIVVINNLQGRLDHILSVINLLEAHPNVSIRSARQDAYVVSGSYQATLPIGTTLSLMPITEQVQGVVTAGLFYALAGETLYKHNSRGLSNKTVDKNIEINFIDGRLLVIINRLEGQYAT